MNDYITPDLCDAYPDDVKYVEVLFQDFGGHSSFGGEVVTLKCFEDNSLVREQVATDGAGKVLVVDGGGMHRRALLGDMLAEKAVKNGWHGIIINGCVRDVDALAEMDLGVKALAAVPLKTAKKGAGEFNVQLRIGGVDITPGQFVYADNNGVIVSDKALTMP